MKVLLVTPHFFGGGAERVAVILANGLAVLGHTVTMLAGAEDGPNRALLDDAVDLVIAPRAPLWRFPFVVRDTIRRTSPDAIISHQTLRNVPVVLGVLLAKGRRKIPTIVVEHGEISQTIQDVSGLSPKLMYCIIPLVYPFAGKVLSVSANIQDRLPEWPLLPRMAKAVIVNPVVHPGLEAMRAQPPRHRWLAAKGAPVFIGLGRLEPQKNFALLIDSFAQVRATRDARLVIYGEGSLRASLQARIDSAGLSDVVDLAGYIDNPFSELANSDALVLSSLWEGLPTVAIEAMYCGAQVVSTRNSTGIELITEGGRLGGLSDLGDVDGLAANMLTAIADPLPASMLQHKAAEFDYRKVSQIYVDIIRSLS